MSIYNYYACLFIIKFIAVTLRSYKEAKELLLFSIVKDWWEELTAKDKNLIMKPEGQCDNGAFILHQELMKQFNAWKNK